MVIGVVFRIREMYAYVLRGKVGYVRGLRFLFFTGSGGCGGRSWVFNGKS